jgi:hypothetical protein
VAILDEIIDGRSDLVFEYLTEGHAANSTDKDWDFAGAVVRVLRRRRHYQIPVIEHSYTRSAWR